MLPNGFFHISSTNSLLGLKTHEALLGVILMIMICQSHDLTPNQLQNLSDFLCHKLTRLNFTLLDMVINPYSGKVCHWSLVVFRCGNVGIPLSQSHSLIFNAISGF